MVKMDKDVSSMLHDFTDILPPFANEQNQTLNALVTLNQLCNKDQTKGSRGEGTGKDR
jgi:hypothetical protein